MAALTVSLSAPVVRTRRAAQADQSVKSFLFTSQQFWGLTPHQFSPKKSRFACVPSLRTKVHPSTWIASGSTLCGFG